MRRQLGVLLYEEQWQQFCLAMAAPLRFSAKVSIRFKTILLCYSLFLSLGLLVVLCCVVAMVSLTVSGRSLARSFLRSKAISVLGRLGLIPLIPRVFVLVSLVLWYSKTEYGERSIVFGTSALGALNIARMLWVADDGQGSSYGLCLNKYKPKNRKNIIEFVHV